MGGSSLAPEVFQKTFGNAPGYPELVMLDSTHPGAVKSVETKIDLAQSLFLVSSKSGTTTETNSFFFYFWDKLKQSRMIPASISLPSPIRVRRWRSSPRKENSARLSMRRKTSAAAIPPLRYLVWFRLRLSASMLALCWRAPVE